MKNKKSGISLFRIARALLLVGFLAACSVLVLTRVSDNCLCSSRNVRAGHDLEIIKKAISLYDAREWRPLTGTSLEPLVGRYVQEIPQDPWGNDYVFASDPGLLLSFGQDGKPGGRGEARDVVILTEPIENSRFRSVEEAVESVYRRQVLAPRSGSSSRMPGWLSL